MATTQNATPITLTVTDKAAAEVRKLMAKERVGPETAGLRVGVLPGGCSGFRYSLSIEDKPAADDIVIESGGVRCFVDSFSVFFQAEDGLRYYKVTGVQTCALPI